MGAETRRVFGHGAFVSVFIAYDAIVVGIDFGSVKVNVAMSQDGVVDKIATD